MAKKILVTSALPYVNNVPHLGNIIGSVLSADVFARAMRSSGEEVLFICGTDEHGTATETKALEEGLTPQQISDKYFKVHKQVYDWFNISFDHFGRTSKKNHHKITQDIFKKVDDNGYITEDETEQVYCKKCDKFLADRFVEGTCPYCKFTEARGDQCDSCGKLLNPVDLNSPNCTTCGTRPEIRKTKHLFLDLEKLQKELEKWVGKQSKDGKWSDNAIRMTNAWFKEGLKKRAITRDLKWGIPVPKEGYEDKVFYVWFDAPIGYISITEDFLKDKYKEWWYNPDNVDLYQFMGKDNIPFHSIVFPGTMFATKDKATVVKTISSTEYLNYEAGKFSKSRGVGIFGTDAMESGIPADVFRYYLMMNRPETSDSEFNWEQFQERLNNELVGNFGNLVNRILVFVKKFFDKKLENVEHDQEAMLFWDEIQKEEKKVLDFYKNASLREAAKQIMHISDLGNVFFQKREPWKNVKGNANVTVHVLANVVKDLAILMKPIMPTTCENIFKQLNIDEKNADDLGKLSIVDHTFSEPKILFNKIEDKEMEVLRLKFSGEQKDPFTQLDLVVGKIIEVKKHPDADKLFIETVDLGTEQRQIVSGLAKHYKEDELVGKNIIVIANLKPAKLRGVDSAGMLLAAEKKGKLEVVEAPASKPGMKVFAEGITSEPKKEIDIDLFAKVKITTKAGTVVYKGKKLRTDKEEIASNLTDGADIR